MSIGYPLAKGRVKKVGDGERTIFFTVKGSGIGHTPIWVNDTVIEIMTNGDQAWEWMLEKTNLRQDYEGMKFIIQLDPSPRPSRGLGGYKFSSIGDFTLDRDGQLHVEIIEEHKKSIWPKGTKLLVTCTNDNRRRDIINNLDYKMEGNKEFIKNAPMKDFKIMFTIK